jgi:hypothetical protein
VFCLFSAASAFLFFRISDRIVLARSVWERCFGLFFGVTAFRERALRATAFSGAFSVVRSVFDSVRERFLGRF